MEEVPDSPSSSSSSSSEHPIDIQEEAKSLPSSSSSSNSSIADNEDPSTVPSAPSAPPAPSASSIPSYPSLKLDSISDSSSSEGEEKSIPTPSESHRRSIQEKLSSLSQYGIEISVSNPQIKHSSFRKHVLYTVSGNDSLGGFQVLRRYKEFLALRKILMIEWPGCCILSLPPKQVIGNLEPNFIENRRKLLEYFLKNLTKNSYILISEEFQLFLRGPNNFHKSSIVNKNPNYVQIGQKYSKVFENYWAYKREAEVEKEILATVEFFEVGKGVIEKLEKAVEESQGLFRGFEKKTGEIVEQIQELTKMYEKRELYLNPCSPHDDPYNEIKIWCRNNLLEVKGITECVHRRSEIEKFKNSLIAKILDEKKNIERRQSGKKKLVQYLNKKSNEYYISQSETNIHQYEETISSLEIILNISAAIYLQEEVPVFKQKKTNTLQIIIEVFEELGDKEITAFINQFEEIHSKI